MKGETKTAKMLPKFADEISNGGLYSQRVRCGKQNCKCRVGDLHSAYYFFTRQNGKLVKFYIRKSELNSFTALLKQSTEARKTVRRRIKSAQQLLRQMRQNLREKSLFINSLREMQNDDSTENQNES